MTTNSAKVLLAFVALVCLTVLISVSAVSADAGMPIITAIVFYAIGNGITAVRGQTAEPIISAKHESEPS